MSPGSFPCSAIGDKQEGPALCVLPKQKQTNLSEQGYQKVSFLFPCISRRGATWVPDQTLYSNSDYCWNIELFNTYLIKK